MVRQRLETEQSMAAAAAATAPRRRNLNDYRQPRIEPVPPGWNSSVPSQFLDEFGRRARGLGEYLMVAKILQQTVGMCPKPREWVAISDEEFSAFTLLSAEGVRQALARIAVEKDNPETPVRPEHVILFRRSPSMRRSGPRFEYSIIRENLSAGKERELRTAERKERSTSTPGARVVCAPGRTHTFWADTDVPTRVRNAGQGTFEAECIESDGRRELAIHVVSAGKSEPEPLAQTPDYPNSGWSERQANRDVKANEYPNSSWGIREPKPDKRESLRAWLSTVFTEVFRKPLDSAFLDRVESKLADAEVDDLVRLYSEKYESLRQRGRLSDFRSGLLLSLAESAAQAAEIRRKKSAASAPPSRQLVQQVRLNPAEDFDSPWARIKLRLQKQLSGAQFANWFMQTAFCSFVSGELRVYVPDAVTRDSIEQDYAGMVRQAIHDLDLDIKRVTYCVLEAAK
jgi:hypothetical protein